MQYEGNTVTGKGTIGAADKFEQLRLILQNEQHRPVTYEEAADIGESLICFFEVLADTSFTDQAQLTEAAV